MVKSTILHRQNERYKRNQARISFVYKNNSKHDTKATLKSIEITKSHLLGIQNTLNSSIIIRGHGRGTDTQKRGAQQQSKTKLITS